MIDSFNISNPIVFGWSMGAMLAFYYAITRNVRYCVSVCGANVDIGNVILNPLDVADVYNKFFNTQSQPQFDISTLLYKNAVNQIIPFKEIGYAQSKAMSDYTQNIQTLLSKTIQTRLLFITADKDIVVPPEKNITFLKENYPTRLLTFLQFQDEGHGVLYTRDVQIAAAIKKFV
jgi:pimeloyl-ACP methyl ester carboxylesterase